MSKQILVSLFILLNSGEYICQVAPFIESNRRVLYLLEDDLTLNMFPISDSFQYEIARNQIGIPDSTHFGGPEIIEEFGADDYTLFYGESRVYAGHGYLQLCEINDRRLALSNVEVGDSMKEVKQKLNVDFPDANVIEMISPSDFVYVVEFNDTGLLERIICSAPPL